MIFQRNLDVSGVVHTIITYVMPLKGQLTTYCPPHLHTSTPPHLTPAKSTTFNLGEGSGSFQIIVEKRVASILQVSGRGGAAKQTNKLNIREIRK